MTDRAAIAAAAARLGKHVRHTPVLGLADTELGISCPITLKLELLQHTGSFKPRGAFNRLLARTTKPNRIIAASGGNHGAAVAYAARNLAIPAEIYVPATTPGAKLQRIASYGARVVRAGETYAEALAASKARQAETGALEVHAYDDAEVIAGQGTVARELERDAPRLTHVLVAVGGGGLIGGIAAWYAGSAELIGVEPEGCPTLNAALQAGRPVPVAVGGISADSLGAREIGRLVFPIAAAHVSKVVLVNDEAIRTAQGRLWECARVVAEPGGAVALAALISGAFVPPAQARVGVVICGGNTDPARVPT
jgi:threonine dehydratase